MSDRLVAALAELAEAIRESIRAEAQVEARTPDRLLSVDEAAALIGQGRTSVYRDIQAGRLRSAKVGRRRLVPTSAVRNYIDERAE